LGRKQMPPVIVQWRIASFPAMKPFALHSAS
jgi:hypothetical protein